MTNNERAKLWYREIQKLPEDDARKIKWREQKKISDKKYFENHKKKIIEKRKSYNYQWQQKNKEKEKERLHRSYIQMKIKDCVKLNYDNYCRRSKKLGKIFPLSLEQFRLYILSDCYYCGAAKAGGIDKVKNERGYVLNNMEPCCKVCNYMKNKTSLKDFFKKIKAIAYKHSI